MAGDTIGVGVIGPGWMGRTHTHATHTLNHMGPLAKRIRLACVTGRRPEPTERFARNMGFERWTTDWRALVDDPEVEVVANLTVNRLHAAPPIAALQFGKAVLCKKPLGEDEAEGQAMLEAARAAGVTSATGYNYRYVPAVRLMRDLVRAGTLGTLSHYRRQYLQDWGVGRTAAQHLEHGSDGNFSRLIDMLRHFLGDP